MDAATASVVAYADVFDYPLTRSELSVWMLGNIHGATRTKEIERKLGYIFLKGRDKLIALRENRRGYQDEKWEIARRAAQWLSHIPTIHLVGVTGGLAMNNAAAEDDIDLFFIVSDGTLWVSRFLTTTLMDVLRLRRHPQDVIVTNKVCLNMFMTERGMGILPSERDVFSAHEVLQMQPLFVRADTYRRFLGANRWVKKFLPNAWRNKNKI